MRSGPPTSWTIGIGDPDEMARKAERDAPRFRRLKLKLGAGDGLDLDALEARLAGIGCDTDECRHAACGDSAGGARDLDILVIGPEQGDCHAQPLIEQRPLPAQLIAVDRFRIEAPVLL